MLLHRLEKDGLIHPPRWLADNCMYMVYSGSSAYGANLTASSDFDCFGWCFPPKGMIFPHTEGFINNFDVNIPAFDVWQEHHIKDKQHDKEYDFQIYSVVKFFRLLTDNNPNMVDILFVPDRCVLHATQVGQLVREKRRMFLHAGAFHKFKGYAYAQMKKISAKSNSSNPKRMATIEEFGFDTKFAYHIVRLVDECEQILTTGDLNLERAREQMKAVRRGEWTLEYLEEWFDTKVIQLEQAYTDTKLPKFPDEPAIKNLLLNVLEAHYGSLTAVVKRQTDVDHLKAEMQQVLDRYS